MVRSAKTTPRDRANHASSRAFPRQVMVRQSAIMIDHTVSPVNSATRPASSATAVDTVNTFSRRRTFNGPALNASPRRSSSCIHGIARSIRSERSMAASVHRLRCVP